MRCLLADTVKTVLAQFKLLIRTGNKSGTVDIVRYSCLVVEINPSRVLCIAFRSLIGKVKVLTQGPRAPGHPDRVALYPAHAHCSWQLLWLENQVVHV